MAAKDFWKSVVGYEGLYSVSDLGNVRRDARTLTRSDGTAQRLREKKIGRPHTEGYVKVALVKDGCVREFLVHNLVLLAFQGPCPPGLECCHGDGVRTNNVLTNLRWGTRKENCEDKKKHGTHRTGVQACGAKLTRNDVLAIRCSTETQLTLAGRYGVSGPTIYRVRSGTAYSDIQ